MSVLRAVPIGCGHYLPDRVVENAEFARTLDTSDEWIRTRTGIERRHFAAEGQRNGDPAVYAALLKPNQYDPPLNPKTGKYRNVAPVGSAMLWSPFYLAAPVTLPRGTRLVMTTYFENAGEQAVKAQPQAWLATAVSARGPARR